MGQRHDCSLRIEINVFVGHVRLAQHGMRLQVAGILRYVTRYVGIPRTQQPERSRHRISEPGANQQTLFPCHLVIKIEADSGSHTGEPCSVIGVLSRPHYDYTPCTPTNLLASAFTLAVSPSHRLISKW